MTHFERYKTGTPGFTLVEVLIAIAISGLIVAALYSFYLMQKKTGETQQNVAAMQQDLRGLMQMMAQDIHMAGYAPVDGGDDFGFKNGFTFHSNGVGAADDVNTNANSIAFTSDINDASFTGSIEDKSNGILDWGTGQRQQEQFAYRFSTTGVCANRGCIQRYFPSTGNRWENMAYGIDGLEFMYTLRDGTMTIAPAAVDLGRIVNVTVTILAKTRAREQGFRNSDIYRPASCFQTALTPNPAHCPAAFNGGQPYNDNYHRQMLTFTVNCRNLK